jgi:hypothetical protein
MARLFLAILLVSGASAVQAQPPSDSPSLQPSVDSPAQRQKFQALSVCLAEARPRWARQTLSRPYLSKAQQEVAAQALIGTDRCMTNSESEFTFRTSGMVGALAEHFVSAEVGRADLPRLTAALATISPLNVSEDFALCLAARNTRSARDLVVSEMGSTAETEAARRVANNLEACTNPGEQLTVDVQSLRSLMSVALYRGLEKVQTGSN